MAIRDSDEIKKGLIARLKANTTLTTRLYNDDPEQIKEAQWQGTEAFYPGVRVRINTATPFADCNCTDFNATIATFSEEGSSKEADEIAGIILGILHRKGFTSSGIVFYTRTNLIPAIRQDERTWRSEVIVTGRAS